jgi:hypothetical protein
MIEIHNWIDLHRLTMASRSEFILQALDRAVVAIESSKIELGDRCISLVNDCILEAITQLGHVQTEIRRSEDFAFKEMERAKGKPDTQRDD